MMIDRCKLRRHKCDIKESVNDFIEDESGIAPMTILSCFMVLIMFSVGGIGVDLMRHEMERTRIQAVADRAVLAAASLNQTVDPETVVRDYFDKAGMSEYVSTVSVSQGLNYRTVSVDAKTTINTQFMDTMGVPTLIVPASSTAEERINKVEISLVLDVSGSMNTGTKMDDLQAAASSFVDTVLSDDNDDLISISLIPYSQHVNAGKPIFDLLNTDKMHDYSYCIDFDDSDFNSVVFNKTKRYDQMQHFQWNYTSIETGPNVMNTRYDTVCPRYDYETILPFSQDAEEIKGQIEALKPRAGTQIFYGMKWATAMLDPSFRTITQSLVGSGAVDAVFSPRPVAYDDDETLKTIVLMTDGQNSSAVRITDSYYNSESEYVQYNNWNFQYYLYQKVSSSKRSKYYYTKYTENQSDNLLYDICDAAKRAKIVVWTIGFEVEDHGAAVMKYCASSPSHFFRVSGPDQIKNAFDAIANQINQLRLIQ